MKDGALQVLLVEDNPADVALLRASLEETTYGSFAVTHVARLGDAIDLLKRRSFDVVLLDLGLPDSQGLPTLKQIKPYADSAAIVVMTGLADEELGVAALQDGAQDYLVKGHLNPVTLARPLRYAAERKASQTALARSEHRLALALQAAEVGIWDWDLETGKMMTSEHYERVFGLPMDSDDYDVELLWQKVHPEDRPQIEGKLQEAMAEGKEYVSQIRIIAAENDIRWVELRGKVTYDVNSAPVRMMGTIIDITDRKLREEESKRRESEMAHLSRVSTMGQMAAGLAHELNQPLSAILNYATVVQMQIGLQRPSMEMMSSAIAEVMNETRRAGAIISRLRSFLRKQLPRAQPLDINEVVAEALSILEFELRHQGIRPVLRLAETMPQVMADAIQIEQVLVNLIFNALEAMDHAHSPVKSLVLETAANPEGKVAQVSVIDSGPGVAPENQEKLFQPFFTTKPTGLGMGLNICRSIIESHGGRLTPSANPGGGMRFSFTLPLA